MQGVWKGCMKGVCTLVWEGCECECVVRCDRAERVW